jgi:CubicO group peptidase (beta-lactamase class C family)
MTDVAEIGGFVAGGYEPVAREFARNFAERGELGAAFAAVRDGELVVDLWGGLADRDGQRPWNSDTLALIFSGTKGLVAVCLLMLIDRGQLELDAPVHRY